MRSHLLEGIVRHRRARPFIYALEHDVHYFALDLDELDDVDAALAADPAEPPRLRRRSATATTWTRRPRDLRTAFLEHLRAQGEDPTAGAITLVDEPARRSAMSSTRPASSSAGTPRASSGSWSSRSTTPTASGTCTRSDRAATASRRSWPRWTRRSTSRRSSRSAAATRSGSGTSRRGCGSRSTSDQPEGLVLHASLDLARRPLTDRNLLRMLLRHPFLTQQDDRADPLARPAPVAARRPFPSPPRGAHDDQSRTLSTPATRPCAGPCWNASPGASPWPRPSGSASAG